MLTQITQAAISYDTLVTVIINGIFFTIIGAIFVHVLYQFSNAKPRPPP